MSTLLGVGDDVQDARLGRGGELPLLGGVRRVVREVAGRREVEGVLDRGGRVGLELDRHAPRPEPAIDRQRAGGDLQQQLDRPRRVDVGFVTTTWQP